MCGGGGGGSGGVRYALCMFKRYGELHNFYTGIQNFRLRLNILKIFRNSACIILDIFFSSTHPFASPISTLNPHHSLHTTSRSNPNHWALWEYKTKLPLCSHGYYSFLTPLQQQAAH